MKRLRYAIAFVLCIFIVGSALAIGKDHILQVHIDDEQIVVFSDFNLAETDYDLSFTLDGENVPFSKQRRFRLTGQSMTTLYIVDNSVSLGSRRDDIISFLSDSIKTMTNSDMSGIMVLGKSIRVQVPFTRDKNLLQNEIKLLAFDEGDDADIVGALTEARKLMQSDAELPVKKQIILISDGEKKLEQSLAMTALYEEITNAPLPVYTIGVETEFTDGARLDALAGFSVVSHGEHWPFERPEKLAKDIDTLIRDAWYIPLDISGIARDGSLKTLKASYMTYEKNRIETETRVRMPVVSVTTVPEPQAVMFGVGNPDGLRTDLIVFGIRAPVWIWLIFFVSLLAVISVVIVIRQSGGMASFASGFKPKKETVRQPPPKANQPYDHTTLIKPHYEVTLTNMSTKERYPATLEDAIIVGRDHDEKGIITNGDDSISKRHCKIHILQGAVYITDLNSSNGSYLNSERVEGSYPKKLENGSSLRLGSSLFNVTLTKIGG